MVQPIQQLAYAEYLTVLSPEEKSDPYLVLENFFCDTSLQEIRILFDNIFETCLSTDDGPFSKATERGNLLYLKKKIVHILAACEIINQTKNDE